MREPYEEDDDSDETWEELQQLIAEIEEEDVDEVERGFRADRAAVRKCRSLAELRKRAEALTSLLADDALGPVGIVRAHDLIELIDDRVTDLLAGGGR